MREIAVRQRVTVPPSSAANLTLVNGVQLRVFGAPRAGAWNFLQRGDVRAGEYLVDPIELRVVRRLFCCVFALDEMEIVPLLTPLKTGRGFAHDIPSVE
jgi:hypothetical protein